VCASPATFFLCDTYNEYSETRRISHFRCNECGSVFVGNDVNAEELGIAYSSLNSRKYYEEIESENRKKMTTAIDHLITLISKDDKIIDIGTGDGLFVELLNQAGFRDVSAHEIPDSDLSAIKKIADNIYQDFDYSSIPLDKYNAVVMLDVLEHVINPEYVINKCSGVLKTNGVIYFHTPVVTKADRMMHVLQKLPGMKKIGTIWQRGRTSIFHLQNYTPRSLRLLLEKAGFSNIRIEVKNELSWPLARYVKVYLLEKQRLPTYLAPVLTPLFYPLLATDAFNANKAIVSARKAENSVSTSTCP
jgi:ubiquinone/menaquinone biosynthesis C-methylase UbiE